MRQVSERQSLPRLCQRSGDMRNIAQCVEHITTHIMRAFSEQGFRLNRVLPKDGTERMTAPLPLLSVTAAELAADYPAADWEGAIIYVSDGGAGAVFRGSDGTNWVNLG